MTDKHYNVKTLMLRIFLLCPILLFSQNYATFSKSLKRENIKESQIDSVLIPFIESNDDSLLYMYRDYASWFFRKKEIPKAVFYAKKSLDGTTITDSLNIQKRAYLLAFYYKKQKKNRNSIREFEKSISFKTYPVYTTAAYEHLASLYDITGEPHLSIKYWELLISQYILNGNTEMLKRAYYSCARVLSNMDDILYYNKGIQYIQKADSLINVTETSYNEYHTIKRIAATLYNKYETLDISKAENYLFQAQEYAYKKRIVLH